MLHPLAETYAKNIQVSQLKSVLPRELHTPVGIEEERRQFLYWLNNSLAYGETFDNQLEAWDGYKLYIDFSAYDEEDEDTNWMGELTSIFEGQVRAGNYNEFGGQQ